MVGVDLGDEGVAALGGEEGGGEGVAGQGAQVFVGQVQVLLDAQIVVVDVAAEVGGVVGVDGDQEAGVHERG